MTRSSRRASACLRRTLCATVFPVPGSPNPILRLDYQLAILSGRFLDRFLYSFQRLPGALVAASLIAAIRLRGGPIDNSPKTIATIHDSLKLARMVLQRISST
jgi:hypothetical protein